MAPPPAALRPAWATRTRPPTPARQASAPAGTLALDIQLLADGEGHAPTAAATTGVRSLTVSVSTEGGTTWTRVPVLDGRAGFRTPGPGGTVSLRAELTDTAGSTLTQTLRNAYRTR
ncbi:hypothetical protein ACFWVF_30705 [Streptomyces sp. NPDC058659]|uniref:hypothetical protein n=1 Tax=unclassified Streptomyces TaxID=2593676 RepID=UPI00365185AA